MVIRWMIFIAILGILAGITSTIIYNETTPNQPPLAISYNPYETGVYAAGIVESDQVTGSDINIFPEVSGTITRVYIKDGSEVKKNDPLFALDDSVQQAIVIASESQQQLQRANLKNVQDQLAKIEKSYRMNHQSISKDSLDNARNAVTIAQQNVDVAAKQYETDKAVLDKYIIYAPVDGKAIRVAAAEGDYASSQGIYDSYTHNQIPPVQMKAESTQLAVRCFVDEILIPKLPLNTQLEATLFVRGLNNKSVKLQFGYMQPYTQPNIQLPIQNLARVDIRALPVIFHFTKPKDMNIYPGQIVDVYIKTLV